MRHVTNALWICLGTNANIIVWADISLKFLQEESDREDGRYIFMEVPKFNYAGTLLDTPGQVYAATTSVSASVIKNYPAFLRAAHPGGLMFCLNSLLQSRRVLSTLHDDERIWLYERGLRCNFLEHDGKDRLCMWIDRDLAWSQLRTITDFLDLSPDKIYLSMEKKLNTIRDQFTYSKYPNLTVTVKANPEVPEVPEDADQDEDQDGTTSG